MYFKYGKILGIAFSTTFQSSSPQILHTSTHNTLANPPILANTASYLASFYLTSVYLLYNSALIDFTSMVILSFLTD